MRGLFGSALALAAGSLVMTGAAAAQIAVGDPEDAAVELEGDFAPSAADEVADPWEGFNRRTFALHLFLDDTILVPAARAYRATTPAIGRKGLRNFLANAQAPFTLVNDLLQGEFERAGETTGRFLINSTIGFLGFADPAERMGIAPHTEDFGQTLAVWGVDSGPFLFLPFFGPSSVRDGVGLGVDFAMDPLTWVSTNPAAYARYARAGATAVARREPLIEPLEEIEAKSLDYYASFRSFYLQARKREIANGRTSFEDLPDIGDYDEFEELE